MNRTFLPRLLLSYCLVPLIGTLSLLAITSVVTPKPLGDWQGFIAFNAIIFTLAAMVVLGTPLLVFYRWRGWTSFLSFAVGGGLCATITCLVLLRPGIHPRIVAPFTAAGVCAGAAFRLILFGARQYSASEVR
jgi:hypothetical protein